MSGTTVPLAARWNGHRRRVAEGSAVERAFVEARVPTPAWPVALLLFLRGFPGPGPAQAPRAGTHLHKISLPEGNGGQGQ